MKLFSKKTALQVKLSCAKQTLKKNRIQGEGHMNLAILSHAIEIGGAAAAIRAGFPRSAKARHQPPPR
jgi:hypothetical protein